MVVKVGVLGYGSMGRRHAEHAAEDGHTVIVYDPCSPWDGYASHGGRVNAVDTEEAALAYGVDAVVIASPASEHARQFWLCAHRSLPVFIEKPLAESEQQFWHAMNPDVCFTTTGIGVATAAGRVPVQMVGYNLRFHAGMQWVQRHLRRIGCVLVANVWVHCDRSRWPGRHYAHTVLECSHEIDLVLWLVGEGTVVSAKHDRSARHWRIALRHSGAIGPISIVELHDAFDGYSRGGLVEGTLGRIDWSWDAPTGHFIATGSACDWNSTVEMTVTPEDTYRAELRTFLQAVERQDVQPRPYLQDGLQVLRAVDRARGKRLSVGAY
jgi:predicted dehydrogenase